MLEGASLISGEDRPVGPGNPPKDTRFKPGNRASVGRRNGFHLKAILKRMLAEPATDGSGKTKAEQLVQATVDHAVAGHGIAMKEIWNRIEGMQEKNPDPVVPANRSNFETALTEAAESVWVEKEG